MTDVKRILLVADYGPNDLAAIEVKQRLYEQAAERGLSIAIDYVSVDSFNTEQTALRVAQGVRSGNYDLVYHNTAPRFDKDSEQVNNAGEFLAHTVAQSEGGKQVAVVGVFSGNHGALNTFALLPEEAREHIHQVDCANSGTQFRSRDIYVEPALDALEDKIRLKGKPQQIPPTNAPLNELRAQVFDRLPTDALEAHRSHSREYVTIIAPKENPAASFTAVQELHHESELDALLLKTDATGKGRYGDGRWIEAGFAAAQLAMHAKGTPARTIYAFTKSESRPKNCDLYEAVLDNGAKIITDDIRALAFAKSRIPDGKVLVLAEPDQYIHIRKAQLDQLAPLPDTLTPGYVDTYGNVKLVLTQKEIAALLQTENAQVQWPLAAGARVTLEVTANGVPFEATITNGSFDLGSGQLALSSGSSTLHKEGQEPGPAAELFIRGKHAQGLFNDPEHPPEKPFLLQPGHSVTIHVKAITQSPPSPQGQAGPGAQLEQPKPSQQRGA